MITLGIASVVAVTGLVVSPSAEAVAPQSRLPVVCRHLGPLSGAPQDLCRALVAGDVEAIIAMCHRCAAPDLAAQAAKWRDPAYRKAMLRALRVGGEGADVIHYPSFASGDYMIYNPSGSGEVLGYDIRGYPKRDRLRAHRFLRINFPEPIHRGWMPSYRGPVVVFGFTYDTPEPEGRYYFEGTYDFASRTTHGDLCDWPSGDGCV